MKTNKIAFAIIGVLALASCGDGGSKVGGTVEAPYISTEAAKPSISASVQFDPTDNSVQFQNIAVHDPSVIKADGNYYIFGSHLAAAKSTDLLSWEYISVLSGNESVDDSPLFNTYTTEIAEGIEWTDGFTGNWAANVIKAPNGKYWFYYNHCAQDNPDTPDVVDEVCWNRSYLGLAEADNIEGPYVDKGVFLRSGYRNAEEFAAYPLDNGQETWDGFFDPNAIDPTAYYDKDGNLWMVYGSYSGGIFVLALDEETGKPEAGQGYGKHLVGGGFRAMEGAFTFYSPESDYYYLMWSVAGFDIDGGYNIRVARAKSPQGPYFDAEGVDVATLTDGLDVGTKLMGGFEYTQEIGETAEAWGYQAPGHNSAYYDEATGRHLLVTHTRFPQTSTEFTDNANAHQVRVHEMFVNKDGWLVSSPQRYVPLDGDNVVDKSDTFGYYKFINHGSEVNTSAIRSGNIALNTDMTVTGSETGVWYMLDPENIKLELSSGTYVGVLKYQWDDSRAEMVPTFSALSTEGATVWGSYVDPITATQTALQETYDSLDIKTDLSIADEGYSLPTLGKHSADISWQSSDEYYIGNDGSVFIPTPDRGDKTITLTANVSLNGQTISKDFTVNLEARPEFKNAVAHYQFEGDVTNGIAGIADATVTTSNMLEAGGNAAYTDGQSGQAFSFDGATGVKLPTDVISSDSYTVSMWVNPTELATHTPAFFMSPIDNFDTWTTFAPDNVWFAANTSIWSKYLDPDGVDQWGQIVTSANAAYNQWTHYTISYGAGEMKLYIDGSLAGSMPRPDMFSAGGDFGVGTGYGWDPSFKGLIDEVIVYDYELGALDIGAAAMNNLTNPADFASFVKDGLALGDTSAIRESFELPRVGPFVSGISWSSDNPAVLDAVNGMAVVTQPGPTETDATVTLTATINFQGTTDTKTFAVTIKSKAPAEFSFEGDLTSVGGAYGEGSITGDRIDNSGDVIDYVDGVVGQAVKLNGSNGVRLPDNLITTSQYSVAFWLRPDAFTSFSTSFFAAANTSSWVSFVPAWGDGALTRLWSGTAWYDADPGGQIPAQEWSHIAFTVDNGAITLYIDGQARFSGENYPNIFGTGATSYFGIGVNHWDVPFNGAMDELKIYSDTISADLVLELYNQKDAQ